MDCGAKPGGMVSYYFFRLNLCVSPISLCYIDNHLGGASLNNFVGRWDESGTRALVDAFKLGTRPVSPFGLTEQGREDFRGINVGSPVIVKEASIEGVDLSFSKIKKLLLIDSHFSDSVIDGAEMMLLNNSSSLSELSFVGSAMSMSGSVGAAKFKDCDFTKSNLSNSIFKEGAFERCLFNRASLKGVDFGLASIKDSRFEGPIEECFFRGESARCDFSRSIFIDCAFYGVVFKSCDFSGSAIWIRNWSGAMKLLKSGNYMSRASFQAKELLFEKCKVWETLSNLIRENVVEYRDFVVSGGDVADEIFGIFKKIKMDVEE